MSLESLISEAKGMQAEMDELATQNEAMENELFELRGFVPYFPPASAASEPQEYIRLFNKHRHLKEIPQ